MGYWSKHPMGGDTPADCELEIEGFVMEKQNIQDFDDWWNLSFNERQKLMDKYKMEILNLDLECEFAIPYVLLNYDIKFDDKNTIDLLKEMIGDGGAFERGYDHEDEVGPHVYATAFKRNIYYLFDPNISKEKLLELIPKEDLEMLFDKGLLASLKEKLEKGQEGLLNEN